jgi:hypothetical protein
MPISHIGVGFTKVGSEKLSPFGGIGRLRIGTTATTLPKVCADLEKSRKGKTRIDERSPAFHFDFYIKYTPLSLSTLAPLFELEQIYRMGILPTFEGKNSRPRRL